MKNLITKIGFLTLLLALPMQAHAAKMALSPASAEFKSGCVNSVDIIVNTEGENTMAVDAFLKYNPNEIEIVDMNSAISGTQIQTGHIYDTYPGNVIQNGKIWVTGVNKVGFYNGRGTFGAIFFKSKPNVTKSSISFDFTPGSTIDSNVANSQPVDVLNAAYGATFTFVPGTCEVSKTPAEEAKTPPSITETQVNPESEVVKPEIQPCPTCATCPSNENLKPVAPAPTLNKGGLYIIWIFLVFLVISLLVNVWVVTEPEKHNHKTALKLRKFLKKMSR